MQTNVFNDPNFVDPDPIHPATKSFAMKEEDDCELPLN